MRTFIKDCKQCGTRYQFQASGYGCNDELNDENYCPDCMEIIRKIPKKFEKRFVDCVDFSKEQSIQCVKEYEEGKLFKRVFPSLYDPETKTHSHEKYFIKNNVEYHVHWWDDRDEWSLKKEIRWDLEKNKEAI